MRWRLWTRAYRTQQNLGEVGLAILLLEAPSNRLTDLTPLVQEAKARLSEARPGADVSA
jgi:hypothetical protein